MSQFQAVRVRSQRTAAAAVERARLSLVQTRPSRAPRAPFAALVFVILGAGVVGLLMFNTHMQQASFYAASLQTKADQLEARSQALSLKLEQLRDPQRLATAGRALGMVTPPVPATINLQTGRIDGIPTPATAADATSVRSQLPPLPPQLNKRAKIVYVRLPAKATVSAAHGAKGAPVNGAASHKTGSTPGRNNAQAKH